MREIAVSADRSAVSSNSIVHALSRLEGKRLVASCTALELRYGAVLFQPGEVLKHVYFPTSGLVSLLTPGFR